MTDRGGVLNFGRHLAFFCAAQRGVDQKLGLASRNRRTTAMARRRSLGVRVALKIFCFFAVSGALDPMGADCPAAGWLASWLWMEGWHPWIDVPLAEWERCGCFLTAWRWIFKGEMRDMAGHESGHACLGYSGFVSWPAGGWLEYSSFFARRRSFSPGWWLVDTPLAANQCLSTFFLSGIRMDGHWKS